ncbi:MAG: twin-arginine translocase subunit TatB [Alphaproteobacteria bacterium]|nr:MAG: twin-arginine translocase subunit TatB [Alphaproteobacteria bacterium]
MLDIGWSELLVIGVVALIVVGPKDLPAMFRTVGQYVGKARSMAREFQRSMEDAARQAELDEVRKAAQSVQEVGRIAAGGIGGAARVGAERLARGVATPAAPAATDAPAASPAAAPAAPPAAAAEPPAATGPVARGPAPAPDTGDRS